jgi:nucleoside 2-deoxyribosyltransferase
MNVYFACSVTGGREAEAAYQTIVATLESDGHIVPTAHLSQPDVIALEAVVDPQEVYTRDIDWINDCQALIAEVSTPSHGVGYEISYALSIGKPVLCCYQQSKPVSKMLAGNTHSTLHLKPYQSPAEIAHIVREFLAVITSST